MCVDVDRLTSTPIDASVRQRLRIPDGPLLLNVARLQEYKGHRYLIQAAAQVLAERPDVTFAIAGEAVGAEQKRYLADLRSTVDSLGLQHRVQFVGFVSDTDLINLYRSASALVHAAVREGFGITLQEAMAFGVPVIAAAAEGPRVWIASGQTGLLVPPGNASALAEATLLVLRDDVLARRLSDAGREVPRAGLEVMVRETAEVYRRILSSKNATIPKDASRKIQRRTRSATQLLNHVN
jgi:glycosyltransferase involved in cell wall biosynthesis